MTAEIIYGTDFRAKREKEAAERFADQVANLAIGETAEISLGELCGNIGPIEQVAEEILKQINPFDKEPA